MMIVVAGKIGAGKSTLTELLSEVFEVDATFEPVNDDGLLELFYKDQTKYGFVFQISILTKRFDMIKKALSTRNGILDRSIYEDAIFVQHLFEDGKLNQYEYEAYHRLLDEMLWRVSHIPKQTPDAMVYVDIDFENEIKRINSRARDFELAEEGSELYAYYQKHSKLYDEWFEKFDAFPTIRIDANVLDYASNPVDRFQAIKQVGKELKKLGVISNDEYIKALKKVKSMV